MTKIDDAIAELAEPLRALLVDVRDKRQELKDKDVILEADEKQLVKALRAVDPTFEPAKPKTESRPKSISEGTIIDVRSWLEARRAEFNGDSFSAKSIFDRGDYDIVSQASLSVALRELHTRGVLALHHIGRGNAKHYTLV